MILTGPAIEHAVTTGTITIRPFSTCHLNPNSYNYHLGREILTISPQGIQAPTDIPDDGMLLVPERLYLAHTAEEIGSREFAMTLLGRSSTGRLGLFVNITADLGHQGSKSHWTLEFHVVQPLRVYAGMPVGQIAFWRPAGAAAYYRGRYLGQRQPSRNLDRTLEDYRLADDSQRPALAT